jgi:hypothetical protein
LDVGNEVDAVEGADMTEDRSHRWRVRWETPNGMFTFEQIHRAGLKLSRSEVEAWAAAQVQERPKRYARVAACYPVEEDGDPRAGVAPTGEKP